MSKTKRKSVPKKKKHVFQSYTKDGIRYMLCSNSIEGGLGPKYWAGKICNRYQKGVGSEAPAIVCWRCTADLVGPPEINYGYKSTGRPRGWQFMKEFVDTDGTVFYKGKEQPKLKGTLKPTKITKSPVKKISKVQKDRMRQKLLAESSKLRRALNSSKTKKDIRKYTSEIRKIERKLQKI
jgi:hypothetical protein